MMLGQDLQGRVLDVDPAGIPGAMPRPQPLLRTAVGVPWGKVGRVERNVYRARREHGECLGCLSAPPLKLHDSGSVAAPLCLSFLVRDDDSPSTMVLLGRPAPTRGSVWHSGQIMLRIKYHYSSWSHRGPSILFPLCQIPPKTSLSKGVLLFPFSRCRN